MAIIDNEPNINGALKHIDVCESNIKECIETNIIGVQNVTPEYLKKVLFISTDKTCNPIRVYGILAESTNDCVYLTIRLGNLLNSSGSLIPKLINMGEFKITDPNMTRFFLTFEHHELNAKWLI